MVWEIPYTFIAGTKAKANEVNGNFTSIKQFVDQLESNLATAELDINNLETNKADINGSQNEVFQVADAENNKDAVNLETLNERIANSKGVINGFDLVLSGVNQIVLTSGVCYDSTMEEIITSTLNLTINTSTVGANQTQYIYVVYNKDTKEVQGIVNANATTPSMPVGFAYFRRIGIITTNVNGHIDYINKDGLPDLRSKVGFIGTYIGEAASTTVATNVWLYVAIYQNNATMQVAINGLEVASLARSSKWGTTTSALIPCQKGQVVQINHAGFGYLAKWYSMT